MTLGEGKRKALELLDEYGDGSSVDEELEAKLPDFFDMAQKQIAQLQPIVRLWKVEREKGVGEYELPENFRSLRRVYIDGRVSRGWRWHGEKIVLPEGTAEIEYNAAPRTVSEATPETYAFEVGEEACAAMPFFAAGMALATDLVQSPNTLLAMYNMMIANLTPERTGGGMRQTFWTRSR